MRLENSAELDEIYKLFGICAHHCSNIEYRTAFLLHPVKWKKHRTHLDSKKHEMQEDDVHKWLDAKKKLDEILNIVEKEIDDLYKVSLGNLIKQIKDNYPLTDEQAGYFKEILEKRNYVIHKMWGDYGRRLKDIEVIKEMSKELTAYELYFRTASAWLQELQSSNK